VVDEKIPSSVAQAVDSSRPKDPLVTQLLYCADAMIFAQAGAKASAYLLQSC